MLITLTRKICPLMTLAIATIGCGKKITQADARPGNSTENQEIPSTFVIGLDGSSQSRKEVRLPESARFYIPDRLQVLSGNTNGKFVEIAYDVDEDDDDFYRFKCAYVSSINPYEMTLDKCVNDDEIDYGDVSNYEFPLKRNAIIQMRFTGAPAQDLNVEAIYSMKWIAPN
jgi:hypothetical protein